MSVHTAFSLSLHPLVDAHIISIVASVNNASVNMGVQGSLWDKRFFHYIPRSGIAGSYGSYAFNFGGTSILFSIVTAPIYTSTNSVWGLPFLHILSNTCYLIFLMISILTGGGDISLWFWFAFPWWPVMLSHLFKYLLAISMFLFGENVYSGPLAFFNQIIWGFCLFIMLLSHYEFLIRFGY